MVPPWRCTIVWQIDSPMPVPRKPARTASLRWNRWKISDPLALVDADPVVLDLDHHAGALALARSPGSRAGTPGRAYLTALPTRLAKS